MKSPLTHLVLAFLVCAATMIGYGVWYSIIQAKSSTVATLEQQIEVHADTQTRVAAARASLAEIAHDEAGIQGYFISEEGVASFSDELESKRHASGATVKVLSVSKSGTGAQAALTFTVSIDGSFDAVMRTIGIIEYAPYAVTLSTVSINEGEETKGGWHADLTLLISLIPAVLASTTPTTSDTATNTP